MAFQTPLTFTMLSEKFMQKNICSYQFLYGVQAKLRSYLTA
ncbi:hypothetical protein BN3590_01387 [Clostridium sp. C105KSO15]|nr:hypothetical protein BN3590_01387 [Clostridium sp. C105KSO15]